MNPNRNARDALPAIPCRHESDAIVLEATDATFCYCTRCERGYAAPAIPA